MGIETVAILSPGEMGSAVGRAFAESGYTVITSLDGRGEPTRERALAAGFEDGGSLAAVIAAADIVIAILPPEYALAQAEAAAAAMAETGKTPPYADCNAVAPETAVKIGEGRNRRRRRVHRRRYCRQPARRQPQPAAVLRQRTRRRGHGRLQRQRHRRARVRPRNRPRVGGQNGLCRHHKRHQRVARRHADRRGAHGDSGRTARRTAEQPGGAVRSHGKDDQRASRGLGPLCRRDAGNRKGAAGGRP